MNNINKEWHLRNKMPRNPTLEQRIAWDTAHLKNCKCRKGFPEKMVKKMKEMGILVSKYL